ncbi:hypothetical protein SSAG_00190 [Streptomyces sp. Mg1]|nr:hypothetical protein SSAG_00190 [Streptomyces sp. Mg1]
MAPGCRTRVSDEQHPASVRPRGTALQPRQGTEQPLVSRRRRDHRRDSPSAHRSFHPEQYGPARGPGRKPHGRPAKSISGRGEEPEHGGQRRRQA